EAWRLHASARDQRLGLGAVDLGPGAARRAGGKALQAGGGVERLLLAVDPPPRQRRLERRRVGERARGALLGDAEEDAGGPGVVRAEPRVPLGRARWREHRLAC